MPYSLRTLSSPIQKPRGGLGAWEKNRDAPLTFGLGVCILFDGSAAFGSFFNYAATKGFGSAIASGGGTPEFNSGSPVGGVNLGWAAGTTAASFPFTYSSGNIWTASALIKFPGSALSADYKAIPTSGTASGAITLLSSGNGDVFQTSNHNWTTKPSAYAGWHRVTVSESGASGGTLILYIDGLQVETFTGAYTAVTSWGFLGLATANDCQINDGFIWSRVLSAQEVVAHNADPYGSVLRPRWFTATRFNSFGGRAPISTPVAAQAISSPAASIVRADTLTTRQGASTPAVSRTLQEVPATRQGNSSPVASKTLQDALASRQAVTTPTKSFTDLPNKALQGITTPTGSRIDAIGAVRQGTSSPLATDIKAVQRGTHQGVSSPIASNSNQTGKQAAGASSPIASRGGLALNALRQASTAPVTSILRAGALIRRGTSSPIASIATPGTFVKTAQGASTPVSTLLRSIGKLLRGSSTPVSTMAQAYTKAVQAVATQIASLRRAMTQTTQRATSSLVATVTVIRVFIQPIQGAAAALGLISLVTGHNSQGAASGAGSYQLQASHNEQGLSVPIGVLARSWQATRRALGLNVAALLFTRAVTATSTSSLIASLKRQTSRALAATLSPLSSGTILPNKAAQAAVTPETARQLIVVSTSKQALVSPLAIATSVKAKIAQALTVAVATFTRAPAKALQSLTSPVAVAPRVVTPTTFTTATQPIGSARRSVAHLAQTLAAQATAIAHSVFAVRSSAPTIAATLVNATGHNDSVSSVPVSTMAQVRGAFRQGFAFAFGSIRRNTAPTLTTQVTFPQASLATTPARVAQAASSPAGSIGLSTNLNELNAISSVASLLRFVTQAVRQAVTNPLAIFTSAPVHFFTATTTPVASQTHLMGQVEQVNTAPVGTTRQDIATSKLITTTPAFSLTRQTTRDESGPVALVQPSGTLQTNKTVKITSAAVASIARLPTLIKQGVTSPVAAAVKQATVNPFKWMDAAVSSLLWSVGMSRSVSEAPAATNALTAQPVALRVATAPVGTLSRAAGILRQGAATIVAALSRAVARGDTASATGVASVNRQTNTGPQANGAVAASTGLGVGLIRRGSAAPTASAIKLVSTVKRASAAVVASIATQRGHLSQAVAAVVATLTKIRQPMPRPAPGRLVVYRPDMAKTGPALSFTAMAAGDTDWFWLDLAQEYALASDTITLPTASAAPIGTETVLTIDSLTVETWAFTAQLMPGQSYVSNGPRIKMRIVSALANNNHVYRVVIGWTDSDGETLSAVVHLPIGEI